MISMAQVLYHKPTMMIRSCKMMRRNSGFTAFEVVITLAIMAVLATFVMPPYLKWLRAYRLRGATINLMADLEMARVRAIRENAFVDIQLAADHYTIFVDNGEGGGIPGDFICNGGEVVLRNRPLPAGVSIDLAGLTLADHRTRFNGRGLPPDIALPETIPVVNSTDRKQIVINRLGYMNVQ
jgi:type IV fimbrial biogenesis protein FimT